MNVIVAKEMMKKEMMMNMVKQKNTRENIRELIKLGCGKLASFFLQTAQFKKGS
jgi:hypothetical protein